MADWYTELSRIIETEKWYVAWLHSGLTFFTVWRSQSNLELILVMVERLNSRIWKGIQSTKYVRLWKSNKIKQIASDLGQQDIMSICKYALSFVQESN